jgi:hypothetical protein
VIKHRLIECMDKAHTSWGSREEATLRINKIDKEFGEYMQHAERKCWRIKSGRIPFSPEAALWITGTQVYQS